MSADYPQLTEDEKYAIFANIPYQIHEGVPIEVIEEELRAYGLDHNIDEELSDRVGVILHNDDEMIHSVRGTDFTNARDVVTDLGLALGNPTIVKAGKTIALAESIPYFLHSGYLGLTNKRMAKTYPEKEGLNPDYPSDVQGLTSGGMLKPTRKSSRETPEHMEDVIRKKREPQHEVARRAGAERRSILQTQRRAKQFAGAILTEQGVEGVSQIADLLPDYLRIDPERERLEKALEKHPNKTPSLTGHSLGSLVNVLGRENNIKSITFNPAPQGGDIFKGHHPDSKVYRIKGDVVSYKRFRTEEDSEPVTEFDPRYGSNFYHYHLLNQFIPEKPKPQIAIPLYSPVHYRPTMYNNKIRSVEFDFCKYNPDNPKCIKISREKEYY